MAIEQFVKHIESLHDQQSQFAGHEKNRFDGGPIKSVTHISDDLVKLKDLLKQAMDCQSSNR